MERRKVLLGGAAFALLLAAFGLVFGDARTIPQGLWTIYTSQDVLITDYMAVAGLAAACLNAALVTLLSLAVLALARAPMTGYCVVVVGLMSGFSFFGKNLINILPILAGTFLYARARREPFSKYASVGLLSTALAPVVSFFALAPGWGHATLGVVVGLCIGFLLPPLSDYTYRIQNGMNLYNMGFACGLLALVIVPVLSSLDRAPAPVLWWATEYRWQVAGLMAALSLLLAAVGLIAGGGKKALGGYRDILKTSGRAPSDYLTHFGYGPTLINMGVNGLAAVAYLLLTGGDFNGPTVGGILTILGFSAFGKHLRNMVPVMAGVAVGGLIMVHSPSTPALQLAGLFCTSLAPISGHFGWPAGVLAGFLHSAMVLQTGSPAEGVNLYNNGFSAGLLDIVLYAVLTVLTRHRRPAMQDEDFFEAVADQPLEEADDVAEDVLEDGPPRRAAGDRLVLRAPQYEELWYRQRLMEDPATMDYDLDAPGYDRETGCIPFPREAWREWYEAWTGQGARRFYAYVVRKEDGTFVGEVNLHRNGEDPWYEMGVVIEGRYRGEGYGTEALRRLLQYAFEVLGAAAVRNEFEPDRAAALAIHLAAGFTELRREEGRVTLEITRETYLERRADCHRS